METYTLTLDREQLSSFEVRKCFLTTSLNIRRLQNRNRCSYFANGVIGSRVLLINSIGFLVLPPKGPGLRVSFMTRENNAQAFYLDTHHVQ